MVEMARGLGYRTALGDVYAHDVIVSNAWWNAGFVVGKVRAGSVVVLHDRRGWSGDEVELVLRGLKEKGWEIVSLGKLVEV